MTDATDALVLRLVDGASSHYRKAGRFAWHFARGKLTRDPLFVDLLRSGAVPDASCLVDLGSGQGLLAAWLFAARARWSATTDHVDWPSDWPPPPRIGTYLGIDRSRADVRRARRALPPFARSLRGDLRTLGPTLLDRCDVATLFDVLHYLAPTAQQQLLTAIHRGLPPWGLLLLRVGDDDASSAARRSRLVDLVVCALRGHPRLRLHQRALGDWVALLEGIGFTVERIDVGSPEGRNVLLRATRPEAPPRAVALR